MIRGLDKNTGERKEQTEWHRIVLHNRLGEIAQQYLRKGSKVYIEGSLRTRQWTDQNGQERYTTEIRGEQMQMLDNNRQQGEQGQGGEFNQPTCLTTNKAVITITKTKAATATKVVMEITNLLKATAMAITTQVVLHRSNNLHQRQHLQQRI